MFDLFGTQKTQKLINEIHRKAGEIEPNKLILKQQEVLAKKQLKEINKKMRKIVKNESN